MRAERLELGAAARLRLGHDQPLFAALLGGRLERVLAGILGERVPRLRLGLGLQGRVLVGALRGLHQIEVGEIDVLQAADADVGHVGHGADGGDDAEGTDAGAEACAGDRALLADRQGREPELEGRAALCGVRIGGALLHVALRADLARVLFTARADARAPDVHAEARLPRGERVELERADRDAANVVGRAVAGAAERHRRLVRDALADCDVLELEGRALRQLALERRGGERQARVELVLVLHLEPIARRRDGRVVVGALGLAAREDLHVAADVADDHDAALARALEVDLARAGPLDDERVERVLGDLAGGLLIVRVLDRGGLGDQLLAGTAAEKERREHERQGDQRARRHRRGGSSKRGPSSIAVRRGPALGPAE